MEDREIVELYWNRSEDAIFATSVRYGAYLRTIADNILHNDADAEECVNDVYLKAWECIPPQRPLRLSQFLGRITRNLSLNRLKQRETQKRGGGEADVILSELSDFSLCVPGPEEAADARAVLDCINQYLHGQKKEKQQVFVLRYWYFLSLSEVAAKTGMSEAKVKTMLFRMRNDLRKHLEKEGVLNEKRDHGRAAEQP